FPLPDDVLQRRLVFGRARGGGPDDPPLGFGDKRAAQPGTIARNENPIDRRAPETIPNRHPAAAGALESQLRPGHGGKLAVGYETIIQSEEVAGNLALGAAHRFAVATEPTQHHRFQLLSAGGARHDMARQARDAG